MALKYVCPACGSDIVVRHLKVGEQAFCRSCGARSPVPLSATGIDESQTLNANDHLDSFRSGWVRPQQAPERTTVGLPLNLGRSAWNPKGFKWIAFFFTFFPALVLAACNWPRLGHPDKKKPLMIIAAVTLPVWLIFVYASDMFMDARSVRILLGILNLVVGTYLGSLQMPVYRNFLDTGGERRGYGRPVFNSILFIVGVVAVMAGVYLVEYDQKQTQFDRGCGALDTGEYETARTVFRDLQGYFGDDPALWYNLGVAYLNLGDLDSAAAALLRGQAIDPNDIDFKLLLTSLHEELGWHPENGKAFTWFQTGTQKTQCTYRQGKLHGTRIEYWPDGTPRRSIDFKDGIADGRFELWNRDQSKLAEGLVVRGRLHGPIIGWNPDTAIPETTAVYDAGSLVRGTDMEGLLR